MRRSRRRLNWLEGGLVAIISLASTILNSRMDEPPRYDGAGYAVLARSLELRRGYREIDHPEAPEHAHFPPGYPLALAALWTLSGPSPRAAHLASIACTTLATIAAWAWFRRMYSSRVARLLGLGLAVNWSWGRSGGSIQSEPLFLVIEMLALLVANQVEARNDGVRNLFIGSGLGFLLGAGILTRHVGVCLAFAVLVDMALRRKIGPAIVASLTAAVVVVPWMLRVLAVGRGTQVELLSTTPIGQVIRSNALFYLRRIPDLLIGPIVEVGTVFRPQYRLPATCAAAVASMIVAWGWWRASRVPRRRLATRTAYATFALLLLWPFTEAGRFLIPLVPILLIGAVEGLSPLVRRSGSRSPMALAAWLVLAASIPYPVYSIVSGRVDASRRTHHDFDLACASIAADRAHAGPVLGRHPGEIYWQTGRNALFPPSENPRRIAHLIDHYRVAFLLIDNARYARAPTSPLGRFVSDHPDRVEELRRFGSVDLVVVRHPEKPKPD